MSTARGGVCLPIAAAVLSCLVFLPIRVAAGGGGEPELEGTTWDAVDSTEKPFVLEFRKGGVLRWISASGTTRPGAWRREGSILAAALDDGSARYRAAVEGDRMEGKGLNRSGWTWSWQAVRRRGRAPATVEETPPLLGTRWSGRDSTGRAIAFRFLPRGALEYETPDAVFRNGAWEQKGPSVFLETNDGFALFRGTIRGDRITGSATNRAGRKWQWSVEREAAPAPGPEKSLVGSSWSGKDSDGNRCAFLLHAGGMMEWASPDGAVREGKWERRGTRILMQVGGGFATFRGTIEGERMKGTAENRKGRKWSWTVTRR